MTQEQTKISNEYRSVEYLEKVIRAAISEDRQKWAKRIEHFVVGGPWSKDVIEVGRKIATMMREEPLP